MAIFFTDNGSRLIASIVIIISIIINFISSFIGGILDKYISYKKLIILGTIFSGLMFIIIGILILYNISKNIIFIAIFFNLYHFFYGVIGPARDTMLMNIINKDNKDKVYRYQYWILNLSVAIGSIIGGLFFQKYTTYIFIIGGILIIVNSMIMCIYMKELKIDKPTLNNKKYNMKVHYISVLKNKKFLSLILGYSMLMLLENSFTSYTSVYLNKNFSTSLLQLDGLKVFSLLNVINTLIVVLLTFKIGKLNIKIKESKIILISVLIYVIGYTVLSYSLNIYILILAMVLASIGEIIYNPLYNAKKYTLTPNKDRNFYSAISRICYKCFESFAYIILGLSYIVSPLAISISIFSIGILGFVLFIYSFFYSENLIS